MFFDQINEIDGNLKDLRGHLKNIGSAVDVHIDHLDDIAAHVIALEAIVTQILEKVDIDPDGAREWIKKNTSASSENEEGSQKAIAVLTDLLK